MRRPVLVACLPAIIGATALAMWLDTDTWWYFAGCVTGGLLMVATYTLGDPPGHIAKWGLGAEGERRTAKALRPLLRQASGADGREALTGPRYPGSRGTASGEPAFAGVAPGGYRYWQTPATQISPSAHG